jgi:hypothetical protein
VFSALLLAVFSQNSSFLKTIATFPATLRKSQ